MRSVTFHGLVAGLAATAVLASPAAAQDQEPIRVGVIYDFTGPFAAGGSEPGAVGTHARRSCNPWWCNCPRLAPATACATSIGPSRARAPWKSAG